MSGVRCFFLTPTGRYRVDLRRYTPSDGEKCPAHPTWGHDATAPFGVEVTTGTPGDVPHDDPHWPARCECGHAFGPGDTWQVRHEKLHQRSDGGPECDLRAAPPGAMWDATWHADMGVGPDGKALVVRLPDGSDWYIDGPSYNADRSRNSARGWTRTGTVPSVTARPSILMYRTGYHAFLTDGVLVPC